MNILIPPLLTCREYAMNVLRICVSLDTHRLARVSCYDLIYVRADLQFV